MEAATAPKQESKPARTKNPSYAVLKQTMEGTFDLIAPQVAASNRKAAIIEATKGLKDVEGDYLVIPTGQVAQITRKTRSAVLDEFS